MTGRRRRWAGAALLVAVVVATCAWWIHARSEPARVGPRYVEALTGRHPGTTVTALDGGVVRVSLPSRVRVDVRLSRLFDTCAADRVRCSSAIDRAVADVDAADALATAPDVGALRLIIVAEAPGYRYGYVTEPLVGALEVRYALVHGLAWTYVTPAIADRLRLARPALRDAALAHQRAELPATLERIDEAGTPIYRVRAAGDATASLIDDERMRRFASEIGARRMDLVVPTRGTLALGPSSATTARALDSLRLRLRAPGATTLDNGLLRYDADAPIDRRLDVAGTTR